MMSDTLQQTRQVPPVPLRLGFGTASLLGKRSPAEGERLLDAALDAGIAYVDTARMYGNGHTEAVVGRVAKRRRDSMVIATKAGILPPSMSFPARLTRKLAGRIGMAEPAFAAPVFHVFSARAFRDSVETSLRELSVDFVDVLMLHDCFSDDISAELLDTLGAMQREGKFGAIGLATDLAPTVAIAAAYPALFQIAQISSSIWQPNVSEATMNAVPQLGIHSIMGARFQRLADRLATDASLRKRAESLLGFDPADRGQLGRLFLAEALASNPAGFVLFSSSSPANIAANAQLAASGGAEFAAAIVRLRELVDSLI
jgi:aryl-alcohol dehydrogenase-like predicted oxidoreductase